jgi:hypothetical protein
VDRDPRRFGRGALVRRRSDGRLGTVSVQRDEHLWVVWHGDEEGIDRRIDMDEVDLVRAAVPPPRPGRSGRYRSPLR